MTRCVECARLTDENQRLRDLTVALWDELKLRYRLASGRWDMEPVPALRMRSGETIEPVNEREAA